MKDVYSSAFSFAGSIFLGLNDQLVYHKVYKEASEAMVTKEIIVSGIIITEAKLRVV